MISNQGKKYLELKQKTNRDVRQLGPIVQFRDQDVTVLNQTEYALSFAVPIANKQLFKLHVDGSLLQEGNDFDFIEITSGYSSKIKLLSTPIAGLPMDYELSGARIAPFPNPQTVQAEIDALKSRLFSEQVGEIKAFDSMGSSITLNPYWKECDGSLISDAASPFNGKRIRNLNGANVALTLTWTADAGGAYATVDAVDINALNIGDSVTGTGITNVNGQPPQIIDIDNATRKVTINNTVATGSIISTFTNDGIYLGGGDIGSARDQVQSHIHQLWGSGTSQLGGAYVGGMQGANTAPTASMSYFGASSMITEGVNGTPRVGARTRPQTRYVKYIMRIK